MTDAASLSQPLYGATFGQAVSRFFAKYATFSGRASRSEYWWVVLFMAIINGVIGVVYGIAMSTGISSDGTTYTLSAFAIIVIVLWGLFGLATLIPGIAVVVRRLHDGNFSGWLYLVSLIPGGSIVVLILTLLPSNAEGARFDAA